MNQVKVFVLLAGLTGLFGTVGFLVAGRMGMILALGLATVMNVVAFFRSAKMVLRAYQARVVSESEAPELYRIVDRLRQRAGLPMPTIAIAPHSQPNAFATGRNADNAVVCVTEGLMRLVDQDELEGVLAHELGHIQNRDMLLQTVSASIAGAIGNLSSFAMVGGQRRRGGSLLGLVFMVVGPIGAMILQFAISRQREFEADRAGAEISRKPLALASALTKLASAAQRVPMRIPPSVAALAVVNPLAAFGGVTKLFATHPSTAERVRRLEALAAEM